MAESLPTLKPPLANRDIPADLRCVPAGVESGAQSLADYARILRTARLAAGLSLRALAQRAGTSHPTLVAYERGSKTPAISTFLRVLNACNCAVDVRLKSRVRARNDLDRGEELAQALELAEQFPSKYQSTKPPLEFPRFGARPE